MMSGMVGLIARREFAQRVRSRGFWLTTTGTPVLLLALWGLSGLVTNPMEQPLDTLMEADTTRPGLGYVDEAGLIRSIPHPAPADVFQAFASRAAAEAALEAGRIEAYYVIPAGYGESKDVERFSRGPPAAPPDTAWMNWILVRNLFPEGDARRTAQLRWPFQGEGPLYVNLGSRGETGAVGGSMLPLVLAMAAISPLFTSGSFLFQGLAEEKRGRILEILVSSTRTEHIFWGKLMGLGLVTVVQYAVWTGLALPLVLQSGSGRALATISLTWNEVLLFIPLALGGYLLYAGLMAGIGAMTPDEQNSRAWVLFVTLPLTLALMFWPLVVRAPNGTLAAALSLFPPSAPLAMLMRMSATTVPAWQMALSASLLLTCGILTVIGIARVFRAHTLLAGERFSLLRLLQAARQGDA